MDYQILIVDDEEAVRFNLKEYLEDEGFQVHCAASAEEGLKLLDATSPDIGIIDMRLPGIDGCGFIEKAHQKIPHMKYLIHTGSTDFTPPRKIIEIGVQREDIFHKPVLDMDLLVQAIVRLMKETRP